MELVAYNPRQHLQQHISASGLSVGRDGSAVEIAIHDDRLSDFQFIVRPKTGKNRDKVQIENHGRSIVLDSGRRIHGGGTCTLQAPVKFWIGETCFGIEPSSTRANVEALTMLPSFNGDISGEELAGILGKSPAATTLIHWLQSIGTLQRSVGGSQEFFADAAHAVFDPGGLDAGMVLMWREGTWEIAESFISNPELGIGYLRDVVEECARRKQTVFHDVSRFADPDCELQQAVIASPIFDHDKNLVGVVYGSRCRHRNNFRQGIRPLEAQFIQVISECVTAAMVRLAREADAARTRVQFEQVFSPKLVEILQRDPSILDGHEREVTVMFCDMRASSVITDQLIPRDVYNVLSDVMDHLTERIIINDGVIIDYYGDGLAAFWNAPIAQANHAELAVKAGLEIIDSLPDLNDNWRNVLGRNIQVGIGIHTGIALVGNSGSRTRMKYGPRGRTVNLACRIEGETKTYGVPILISESTRRLIHENYVTRRIWKSSLRGFDGEFDLFQPFDPKMDVRDLERLRRYEQALDNFETGALVDSMETLIDMELEGTNDAALEHLLGKVKNRMRSVPAKSL